MRAWVFSRYRGCVVSGSSATASSRRRQRVLQHQHHLRRGDDVRSEGPQEAHVGVVGGRLEHCEGLLVSPRAVGGQLFGDVKPW